VIQSTIDLAHALHYGATAAVSSPVIPTDEAKLTNPYRVKGIVPEQSVFSVETVEGRTFRVTVTEDI
jgi:hypothetical protein